MSDDESLYRLVLAADIPEDAWRTRLGWTTAFQGDKARSFINLYTADQMAAACQSLFAGKQDVMLLAFIVDSMRDACRSGVVPPNAPGGTYILSSPSNSQRVLATRRRDAQRAPATRIRVRNARWARAHAKLDIFGEARASGRVPWCGALRDARATIVVTFVDENEHSLRGTLYEI